MTRGARPEDLYPREGTTVYEVHCADPDCARPFLLPEPKPDPWYCPRCWQARGSKESER